MPRRQPFRGGLPACFPLSLPPIFWSATTGQDAFGIVGDPDFAVLEGAFRRLQILHHGADYNFSKTFTRQQAMDACVLAEDAMDAWRNLRAGKPDALRLFATAILLWPGLAGRE